MQAVPWRARREPEHVPAPRDVSTWAKQSSSADAPGRVKSPDSVGSLRPHWGPRTSNGKGRAVAAEAGLGCRATSVAPQPRSGQVDGRPVSASKRVRVGGSGLTPYDLDVDPVWIQEAHDPCRVYVANLTVG